MREKLMTLADFIRKNIKADDYSVSIVYSVDQHTRFAENSITQHISGEYIEVYYKCIKDSKIGSASTRQIDEENILKTIKKAEELAEQNSPDPNITKTLEKSDIPKVNNYFATIEKFNTDKMIKIVKQCVDFAKKKEAIISGIVSKNIREYLHLTGNGFIAFDKSSEVELSMTLRKDHKETKVSYGSPNPDTLDLNALLLRLDEQFESLKEMKSMDFETLPVILRPGAVLNLMWFMTWLYDRQSADEGLTPFTNLINEKDPAKIAFGEKLSMYSTLKDNDLLCQPFSSNNVNDDITWIKNGVIENMPTSRFWAQKNKLKPTSIYNFIIPGENISEEEMMKMVPRGLIVNNLWYIRVNDRKTADLTGMTRDGVLYFEDGEVKYAVNNFRFNEQIHNLTKKIIALGESIQQDSTHKVPAMLFSEFTFVDKTNF